MTDYKKHTKERFKERFLSNPYYIKEGFKDEMTDDEYQNLCELCKDNDIGYLYTKYKKVIQFRGFYMWVAFTKKTRTVKTIFPINKSAYKKLKL